MTPESQAYGKMADRYDAAVVARWLLQCVQSGQKTDYCPYCPFSDSPDCLEALHTTAARTIRKLAGLN